MSDLHLEECVELGTDSGRGNLLGIEPYITAAGLCIGAGIAIQIGRIYVRSQAPRLA